MKYLSCIMKLRFLIPLKRGVINMKNINFEITLTDVEYKKIINPNFFDNDDSVKLYKRAKDFTLELEIKPHKKTSKTLYLISNVQKIGDEQGRFLTHSFHLTHVDNFLKIYSFKDSKNDFLYKININLDVSKMILNISKDGVNNFVETYKQRYLSILNFTDNSNNFNKEVIDFIRSSDLSDDLSLISFAIVMNNALIYLNAESLNHLIYKLSYYGYDEESITNDSIIGDFKSCKNCTLTFLLRAIYDNYDGVEKNNYLKEFSPLFSDSEVDSFFKVFITSYLREVLKLKI